MTSLGEPCVSDRQGNLLTYAGRRANLGMLSGRRLKKVARILLCGQRSWPVLSFWAILPYIAHFFEGCQYFRTYNLVLAKFWECAVLAKLGNMAAADRKQHLGCQIRRQHNRCPKP